MRDLPRRTVVAIGVVGSLVVLVLVFAIGSGPDSRLLPPPSSTSSTTPEPTTTQPDFSQIALTAVPGETTSTLATDGTAVLRGEVAGPDGPVPGATVRLERLVGDAVQRIDVATGPDGRYEARTLPGGRFRVRAFLPPTLVTEQTEVFFLPDGSERDLRLVVSAFEGMVVKTSTTPQAPIVGDGVNLAVLVAERSVDADGIGREVPLANVPVSVNASGWQSLDEEPRGVTASDGVVVFAFRCDRVTAVQAVAVAGEQREAFPLDVPPCASRPTTTTTTTTTTTPDSTSSSSSSTSSTTTTEG